MHRFVYDWKLGLSLTIRSIDFSDQESERSKGVPIEYLPENEYDWGNDELSDWHSSHVTSCYSRNESVVKGFEIAKQFRLWYLIPIEPEDRWNPWIRGDSIPQTSHNVEDKGQQYYEEKYFEVKFGSER